MLSIATLPNANQVTLAEGLRHNPSSALSSSAICFQNQKPRHKHKYFQNVVGSSVFWRPRCGMMAFVYTG